MSIEHIEDLFEKGKYDEMVQYVDSFEHPTNIELLWKSMALLFHYTKMDDAKNILEKLTDLSTNEEYFAEYQKHIFIFYQAIKKKAKK